MTEDLKAYVDGRTRPPGGGHTPSLEECKTVPPNHSLRESDLQNTASSFLPKKAGDSSSVPNSELLPFLQNLCGQFNHLRVGRNTQWPENVTKPVEGIVGVG